MDTSIFPKLSPDGTPVILALTGHGDPEIKKVTEHAKTWEYEGIHYAYPYYVIEPVYPKNNAYTDELYTDEEHAFRKNTGKADFYKVVTQYGGHWSLKIVDPGEPFFSPPKMPIGEVYAVPATQLQSQL